MARVNEVVRETLADEVKRLSDPRLGFVTLTDVAVSPDLRLATVYYSVLGTPEQHADSGAALASAASHLRTALGRQVRLKYLPELRFREDDAITQAQRIEAILRGLHRDDAADAPADAGTEGQAP